MALAAASVAPVFRHPTWFGAPYDWRYFQSSIEAARRTVAWWGEAPLWNPWACGGEVLLANPQSEVWSPTFLLHLLLGTALGAKLALAAYLFFAYHGMYLLARSEGRHPAAASLAAVAYGGCGWLALHLSAGQSNFAGAALFPYLVLTYRRAQQAPAWTIVLGALAAWIVGLGGTYTAPLALVLLAAVAAVDTVTTRSWRPLAVLLAGGLAGAVLGAPRVLTAFEFALDHPRRIREADATSAWRLLRFGFEWWSVQPVPGQRYWAHEYGWRLPTLAAPLLAWAALLTVRWRGRSAVAYRGALTWWAVALLAGGVAMGDGWPRGPWWMLQRLPIYRDLRVPSRFTIVLAFACALLCAWALDDLRTRWAGRAGETAVAAVVVLAAVDGAAYSTARFRNVFTLEADVAGRSEPVRQFRGEWRSMMTDVLAGRGTLECDEEAPLQRAASLDEGDVVQARLEPPAAGTLAEARWSPNRVVLDLDLGAPATVLINQNWNEHWRASAGRVVKVGPRHEGDADGGRLGVEMPAGRTRLVVRYRPASFVVGLVVCALGTPLLLAWAWLISRDRRPR